MILFGLSRYYIFYINITQLRAYDLCDNYLPP